MPDLESELIARVCDGDMGAFEEIYRQYAGMVYRLALRMMTRIEDAEEVTQQVFVGVHRHLKTFNRKSSLKTWIYRITVNSSLNALKTRKKHIEVAWEEGFDPQDTHDGVRELMDREASKQDVVLMLEGLNPDQRACLLLRVQEGLSYEEIGRALNVNVNTVRSRLKRARETLLSVRKEKEVAV
ncbi:MAG: RNA polymerase sigma factor [Candidatus Omnitrophota bacterium]